MVVLRVAFLLKIVIYSRAYEVEQRSSNDTTLYCPYLRNAQSLNVQDLVGNWLTVYMQPKAIDCFSLHIRATTDLEREQYVTKYEDFGGRVDWSACLLEVETPLGKHFLQGDGSQSGLLENIILYQNDKGEYQLQEQSADQWMLFGRRGSEVLVLRDCLGEAAAVFSRAPYWPTMDDLLAILHRSGIAPLSRGRLLCDAKQLPENQLPISRYIAGSQ